MSAPATVGGMAARPLGSGSIRALMALGVMSAVMMPRVVAAAAPTDSRAATANTNGPPTNLTVDDLTAPVGLGQGDVFFGWHVNDLRPGAVQTAYRIVVSRPVLAGPARGITQPIRDSGKTTSAVPGTYRFTSAGAPAPVPSTAAAGPGSQQPSRPAVAAVPTPGVAVTERRSAPPRHDAWVVALVVGAVAVLVWTRRRRSAA